MSSDEASVRVISSMLPQQPASYTAVRSTTLSSPAKIASPSLTPRDDQWGHVFKQHTSEWRQGLGHKTRPNAPLAKLKRISSGRVRPAHDAAIEELAAITSVVPDLTHGRSNCIGPHWWARTDAQPQFAQVCVARLKIGWVAPRSIWMGLSFRNRRNGDSRT
eukprot:scaffold303356_cov30-Tisochrysis_lutea.AAC.4